VIGRASPAARLVCALVIVTALATLPLAVPAGLLGALVVVIALLGSVRPHWGVLGKRLLPALLMIAALVTPLLLSGSGARAAAVFARATLAVLAALAFAETLRPEELGAALRALRFPPALAEVVTTLLRQLEALGGEARSIGLARRLRGAHGPAFSADAVATLLIRAHDRAERAQLAQRLRGFGAETASQKARLRRSDGALLALSGLAAAFLHASARFS
jgi:cobalt/nickel transport system permease protein